MHLLEVILLDLEHSLLLLSLDTLIVASPVEKRILELLDAVVEVVGLFYEVLIVFVAVNVVPGDTL